MVRCFGDQARSAVSTLQRLVQMIILLSVERRQNVRGGIIGSAAPERCVSKPSEVAQGILW